MTLEHQLDAIRLETDLFEGLPARQGEYEISLERQGGMLFNELGMGNQLELDRDRLLKNLHVVQERNTVSK